MDEDKQLWAWVAGGGSAVTGLMLAGRALLRRFSRDVLEVTKDRAEADFVAGLLAENEKLRERADKMAEDRADAMRQIGELTARVAAQTEHIARLEAQVRALSDVVDRQRQVIEELRGEILRMVDRKEV